MSLYTIPHGTSFLDALCAEILSHSARENIPLTQFKIMLPNRRAGRHLRETFLTTSQGKPMLLPAIHTIGDIEEEELAFSIMAEDTAAAKAYFDLPAPISAMRRTLILARLIDAMPAYHARMAQNLELAEALGHLLDQMYLENIGFDRLDSLVPAELSAHWQVTVEFLTLLSDAWPRILAEEGRIDAVDRRLRLIDLLARHWQETPPDHPVYLAGIPALSKPVLNLYKAVKDCRNCHIILPGLDRNMGADAWATVSPSHPQYDMKRLLDFLNLSRKNVSLWPGSVESKNLQTLLSLAMLPAESVGQWSTHTLDQHGALMDHVNLYQCDTPEEESRLIALALREVLQTPEKTAALVTPDRALAQRVIAACARWDITLDDTGGRPLNESPVGALLLLSVNMLRQNFKPGLLLSLLKHSLCQLGLAHEAYLKDLAYLEIDIYRGDIPLSGSPLEHPACKELGLISQLSAAVAPLLREDRASLETWLEDHIRFIEFCCTTPDTPGAHRLWLGEDGEMCAALLAELRGESHLFGMLDIEEYYALLHNFISRQSVRPSYGAHPRLSIMGTIEARLVQPDLVIMAGLNEGTWPPLPDAGPWMSRPMREAFGLPQPERSIGQSAHDFIQGISAGHVILTRSLRQDGEPTVPARWIERIESVLHAQGQSGLTSGPLLKWVRRMDQAGSFEPVTRPAPTPPAALRPERLSVSAIKSWMCDPYALYAQKILALSPLNEIERDEDAALKGSWWHAVFERFIRSGHDPSAPEAISILKDVGYAAYQELTGHNDIPAHWAARFDRVCDWFLSHEKEWREEGYTPLKSEITGEWAFQTASGKPFAVHAKADRIDRNSSGDYALIDYKTGTIPSHKDIGAGLAPQLPLEGVILKQDGFPDISGHATYAGHWHLSGGRKPGEDIPVKVSKKDLPTVIEEAETGLKNLVQVFDSDTIPYYSLPNPAVAPRETFQDYAHLARTAEWNMAESEE